MIFYRSDTTPPNKIFSEGFKPKHRLESLFKSNGWLNFAIRSPNDDRVVCDASIYVVSLTYKFESAAIFPVNLTHLSPKSNNHGQEIYIYAISLPDRGIADASSKIEPNVAYDLHSKQVQDLSKILSSDYRLIHNTGYMGFMLAAYEAFALQNSNAPIGISEYELTKAIPEKLQNCLPTIQEIENELNNTEELIY